MKLSKTFLATALFTLGSSSAMAATSAEPACFNAQVGGQIRLVNTLVKAASAVCRGQERLAEFHLAS